DQRRESPARRGDAVAFARARRFHPRRAGGQRAPVRAAGAAAAEGAGGMKAVAIRAGAAAFCVAVAVILVLLAIDSRAWSSRFPADDLRYRRDASAPKLWNIGELSPFGLDRKLLGIKDDLAYRRALREFRLGRPLEPVFTTAATTHRVQAQIALTDVVATPGHANRASQAANLVGVLGFAMATQDVGQRATFLNNAVTAFRQAIALAPTND